jgi:hypothetical protein
MSESKAKLYNSTIKTFHTQSMIQYENALLTQYSPRPGPFATLSHLSCCQSEGWKPNELQNTVTSQTCDQTATDWLSPSTMSLPSHVTEKVLKGIFQVISWGSKREITYRLPSRSNTRFIVIIAVSGPLGPVTYTPLPSQLALQLKNMGGKRWVNLFHYIDI